MPSDPKAAPLIQPGHVRLAIWEAARAVERLASEPPETRIDTPWGFIWRDPDGGVRAAHTGQSAGTWAPDAHHALADLAAATYTRHPIGRRLAEED
jgi:hypothetical protein